METGLNGSWVIKVRTQSQVYAVPEMPAFAWLLPGAASSPGSRDNCLLPGCREWAEVETEGTPLHLDTGQHNVLGVYWCTLA